MKVRKFPYAGKSGHTAAFLKLVHAQARRKSHAEVFRDFLEMAFCAIAKTTLAPGEAADNLEARYMRVVEREGRDYVQIMPELLGISQIAIAEGGRDFFGEVSGELGALNEAAGQFFTPYEISRMMAEMTLGDLSEQIARQGFVTIHEPASGAGGMLLACAGVFEGQGHDVGRTLFAEAVDLSHSAFQMTYLQLSLRGIPAQVFHGNTLSLEVFSSFYTPAFFPFFHANREAFLAWRNSPAVKPAPPPRSAFVPTQLQLF